jgi:hypothetical protein|tara:strand:+ start:278 stop:679 length:402 start_codon:yes stop_codon:yes gene_type:complete
MKDDIPTVHTALWEVKDFKYIWAAKLSKNNIYSVQDLVNKSDLELENIQKLDKKHIPTIRQAQINFMATIPMGTQLSEDFNVLAEALAFYNQFHYPASTVLSSEWHVHRPKAYKNWQALYRVYALANKQEDES